MTRRTTIEIDEELLKRAQEALGTRGLKNTVEAALDQVVRAYLRKRLVERLRTQKGIDLSEKVYRAAKEWRSNPGGDW